MRRTEETTVTWELSLDEVEALERYLVALHDWAFSQSVHKNDERLLGNLSGLGFNHGADFLVNAVRGLIPNIVGVRADIEAYSRVKTNGGLP